MINVSGYLLLLLPKPLTSLEILTRFVGWEAASRVRQLCLGVCGTGGTAAGGAAGWAWGHATVVGMWALVYNEL